MSQSESSQFPTSTFQVAPSEELFSSTNLLVPTDDNSGRGVGSTYSDTLLQTPLLRNTASDEPLSRTNREHTSSESEGEDLLGEGLDDNRPIVGGGDAAADADPLTAMSPLGDALQVNGAPEELVHLRFSWTGREARYNNEIGVFVVEDDAGQVNGIAPGETGYAQAALTSSSRQTLFISGSAIGAWRDLSFRGGSRLGFYLLQDTTHQQWLAANPQNALNQGPLAFFSIDGVNPDAVDHVRSRALGRALWQFNWEDLTGGGDRDFNDVVFTVDIAPVVTPGLAGQRTQGTFEWVSRDAGYRNEIGLFRVDDALGRIGDLLPGDAGYARAAIAEERRTVIFSHTQTEAANTNLDLPAQQHVGWYLIQNASSAQFLSRNPDNTLDGGPLAFFSYAGANPDGMNHLHPIAENTYAWEDLTHGGDLDYDDLIFRYEFTPQPPETPQTPEIPRLPLPSPVITISDVTVTEGEGTGAAQFTVTLSEASERPITVDYATVDGSAVAGSDYQAASGTLTFEPGGPLAQTISVSVEADDIAESTENFFVQLSDPVNAELSDAQGTGTILEQGSTPVITAALTNDTGISSRDRITNAPTIEGTVSDYHRVIAIRAGFNNTPTADFVDVTHTLQNNSFRLDVPTLTTINGGALPDGDYTLKLQAMNALGRASAVFELAFTLDTTPPPIDLNLALVSDSGEAGDQQTAYETVTLEGETEAQLTVELAASSATATADETGRFRFDQISLNEGDNSFTVRTTDIAGNEASVTQVITRVVESANQAPEFVSEPDTEAMAERAYTYDADAADPDEDSLTYELLAGPDGLSIDADTGGINWTPSTEDAGTHSLTLQVSDSRGGSDLQTYSLAVLDGVHNRPPSFITVPVVDANVAAPYVYDANAVDADVDPLSYRLISAPEGMAVDEATGEIFWTPVASQLGLQSFTLQVEDGRGGVAVQEFDVLVLQELGNHAPVIVSEPVEVIELLPSVSASDAEAPISLNAVVRDFSADHPNFANSGPSGLRRGIVQEQLGPDRKPVLDNGFGYITQDQFTQWYNHTPGINLPAPTYIELYETQASSGIYEFSSNNYFPIDNQLLGNEDRDRNFNFTTEINSSFTYQGGEFFNFIGDDDVWLFIDDRLVIDLGGIHYPASASIDLDTLGLTIGESYSFDLFHAERGTRFSHFRIQTSIELQSTFSGEYIYDVNAIDPDEDELLYSLSEAPAGMIINPTSGLISWNPTGLVSSDQLPISIHVEDGRGGFSTQNYRIQVPDQLPGEIQGMVWDDLNENGILDTTLVRGEQPDIFFVIDVSGSMGGSFIDWRTADLEDVSSSNITRLDQELAAILALAELSIEQGLGNETQFGIVTSGQSIIDMNPFEEGLQVTTTALADENNNGVIDIREVIDGPLGGGSSDTSGIRTAWDLHQTLLRDPNIIFMSDGFISVDDNLISQVRADGVNLTAFGFAAQRIETIRRIDPEAPFISSPQQIIDIFGGNNPLYISEPFVEGFNIYLDLNGNGVLDFGEPTQITSSDNPNTPDVDETGQYRFTGLSPGNYIVREVVPDGYVQTFPVASDTVETVVSSVETLPNTQELVPGFHNVFLEAGEVVEGINFGNRLTKNTVANEAPTFTSESPTTAQVGRLLRYEAEAIDQNSDALTYDLSVKPEGMAVDPASGVLVWQPTSNQAGQVHDVILRVQDGRDGFDLQAFQIRVPTINTAPSITSTPPGPAIASLPYQYQVQAQDAEDDALTFQLVDNPDGATIDNVTGVLDFTPTAEQIDNHSFTLLVSDGNGGETTQTFTLEVVADAPNDAPVILSTPRDSTPLDQTYLYQVNATDTNGDPLTFSLITAPSGLTLDDNGLITWTPTADQFGTNSIALEVTDGRGGRAAQTFEVNVVSQGVNQAPEIVSEPLLGATTNREYRYDAIATDPDGDVILWSLEDAPIGMSIDAETGAVRWVPTLEQIGPHDVTLRALDAAGGTTTQTFVMDVRGTNTPPLITSTPRTQTTIDARYTYTPVATDPDGDLLSFSLLGAPEGITLDAETGLIAWTPTASQQGIQSIDLLVTDGQGGAITQSFSVVVLPTAPNGPPVIDSRPAFLAVTGSPYTYEVEAFDPDGDDLTFSLVDAPDGMTIDPATGLLQWTPDESQQGATTVKIRVSDPSGGRGSQSFPLLVRDNDAPSIISTPATTVTAGALYQYYVSATDPDADLLSYTLIDAPAGMTLDPSGRLTWSPSLEEIGNTYQVTVGVMDSYGATDAQTYALTVQPDVTAPLVNLRLSEERVDIGESVTVQVQATDDVGVEALTLQVNDTPIALDAQGRAILRVDAIGAINIQATATDAAGNTGTANTQVFGVDPFDTEAPIVSFSDLVDGRIFTAPEDIIGTVTDDNLAFYSLAIAPIGSTDFTEIAQGTKNITDAVLGTFDPSILENDSYQLRLSATDLGGLTSTVDTQVDAAGDLKLGNFQLSFTDLSIPVSGIPIQVTRTYDTLTSSTTDDFGYGWRMEFRDTNLRTSVAPTGAEEFGLYAPFQEGTRIYVTAPGGRREGFTFQPKKAPGIKGRFLGVYEPVFVPDPGVTSTLSVPNFDLVKSGKAFYTFAGSLPFNPADPGVGNGQYTLTTKEGLVYEISAEDGDLETVSDRNGNTLTFTDNSITSSTGQAITFERDAQNRITAAIDPEGDRITYQYDALGDLIAVTDREGNVTRFDYNDDRPHYLEEIIDSLGRSGVRSEYDDQGRLTRMIDADGNPVELLYDPDNDIQQVRDQLGNITTYVYDARGNVLTERDAEGGETTRTYDSDNNMLTETDPLGNTTTFTYDADNNVLTETDALGNVTRYTYDNFGNVLTTTDPTGQTITNRYDANGNPTQIEGQASGPLTFSYDAVGNLTSMQDGSGSTTFEYDAVGNITRQTDAQGTTTTFTYDANGNRTSETTTQTLTDGTVRTLATQMEYDDEGRVIRTIDAAGGITETIYDAVGNRVEEIDALGRSTKYVYDDRGQLVATIYPDSTPNDDSDNPRTRTEYDARGQVIAEIDELGRRTMMIYDALGRQIATLYPDATPNDDRDNPRTQTEYDAAGRVVAEIDELGNRTEFRYDAAGRVIETILPDETPDDLTDNPRRITAYDAAGRQQTQTDALGQVVQFLYDDLGRPVGQVYADGTRTSVEFDEAGRVAARTDQAGITTRYKYDALGRLTAVVDALDQRTEYTYDEQGNLITQTDANGNTTRYEYDRLGRRVATELPFGERSTSTYDAVGNMRSTTDFNGDTKTYTYDERNRLIAKDLPGSEFDETHTYTANGLRQTVTDDRGTTTYRYDERNRLISRIDPDGTTIAYTYDAAGNRTSVQIPSGTTAYGFDAQNRLKTVTDPEDGVTTYTYNPVGNLERTEFPNGTVEIREYDDLNRLVYIETSGPEGVIASFRYILDDTGNRTALEEHDGRRVNYEYDDLYRLTAEIIYDPGSTGPSRIIEYVYDAVGNRLSRTDTGEGNTLYTYDDNDRLLTATTNGNATTYTYDNNGNTTSKTTDGTTITYTWNADNRLIGADIDGDGAIDVVNQYNENGIRVSQTVNGEETRFLIDANRSYAQVLEEYTPGGIIKVSYMHGNDLISQNRGGEKSFYNVDGLGSTRALSDETGLNTDQYIYDAFGQVIKQIGNTKNSFIYAGEQFDQDLAQLYLRDRYFAQDTGRFTRLDTWNGIPSSPITLNKYIYANSNPVNFIDPSGFASLSSQILASAISFTLGFYIGGQLLNQFYSNGESIDWTADMVSGFFPVGTDGAVGKSISGSLLTVETEASIGWGPKQKIKRSWIIAAYSESLSIGSSIGGTAGSGTITTPSVFFSSENMLNLALSGPVALVDFSSLNPFSPSLISWYSKGVIGYSFANLDGSYIGPYLANVGISIGGSFPSSVTPST